MKNNTLYIITICLIFIFYVSCTQDEPVQPSIIIDHKTVQLEKIPAEWINQAKAKLHIAYGHSTYGSQLITGMDGLETFKGDPFLWNNGALEGSLDIRDEIVAGDLGINGDLNWEGATRSYLGDFRNASINVVIWSWESGVSNNTEQGINTYLKAMNQLEKDYPNVQFVYMTGHLDGTGVNGKLNTNNEQIRKYCLDNNKILYDFADIESYDPDGTYYLDKGADGTCNFDSNADGINDSNWALNWQNNHILNTDWYKCVSANSQALNANLKAYAAWWLWSRLAGWTGK